MRTDRKSDLEHIEASGVDVLRARSSQAIDDLLAGRITAAEADRITKGVVHELRTVEAALRAASLAATLQKPKL